MKLKAHITGDIPQGAVPVFQYSHQGENDPAATIVDVTTSTTGYDLEMAGREISVKSANLLTQFVADRTVKYRFGVKVGNDIYWGAESTYGPREEPHELYHAVAVSAETSGKGNIELLHPLHSTKQVAIRDNGSATLQKLTRVNSYKFNKASGLTVTANKTFTYAILDADDNVLYESLPFNNTTTTP